MNFEAFQNQIIIQLQSSASVNTSVQLQTISKNNNEKQIAVTKVNDGQAVSPVVYLEPFYQSYIQGVPMDAVAAKISSLLDEKIPDEIDISSFNTWEKVKDRIVFRLINLERNQELLERVIYRKYLDLAITYGVLFDGKKNGCAISVVTKDMAKHWQADEEQIYNEAMENSCRLLPGHLTGMNEVLQALASGQKVEACREWQPDEAECEEMYILSNKAGFYGASAMIYTDKIRELSEHIGKNLFILPSSIHELILTPECGREGDELRKMVAEVNSTELAPEDILSYTVYQYDLDSNEIIMYM